MYMKGVYLLDGQGARLNSNQLIELIDALGRREQDRITLAATHNCNIMLKTVTVVDDAIDKMMESVK